MALGSGLQPLARTSQLSKVRSFDCNNLSKSSSWRDYLLLSATMGCRTSTRETSSDSNNALGNMDPLPWPSRFRLSFCPASSLLLEAIANLFAYHCPHILMVTSLSRSVSPNIWISQSLH